MLGLPGGGFMSTLPILSIFHTHTNTHYIHNIPPHHTHTHTCAHTQTPTRVSCFPHISQSHHCKMLISWYFPTSQIPIASYCSWNEDQSPSQRQATWMDGPAAPPAESLSWVLHMSTTLARSSPSDMALPREGLLPYTAARCLGHSCPSPLSL